MAYSVSPRRTRTTAVRFCLSKRADSGMDARNRSPSVPLGIRSRKPAGMRLLPDHTERRRDVLSFRSSWVDSPSRRAASRAATKNGNFTVANSSGGAISSGPK